MGHNIYVDLMYLPYTFLSISYLLDGIIVAGRFLITADAFLILAYFFGHGFASHFINEAYSSHFAESISAFKAKVIGYFSLLLSSFFGLTAAAILKWNIYLLAVGVLEIFFMITYNLPLTSFFHNDLVVSVAVGSLPALAGYIAADGSLSMMPFLLAALCGLIVSLEITPSRFIKRWRRMPSEPVKVVLKDGTEVALSLNDLVNRPERVIKIMLVISYLLPAFLFLLRICS